MADYETCASAVAQPISERRLRINRYRALAAYWILGLCNNYGYVVMLTAAADIINDSVKDDAGDVEYADYVDYGEYDEDVSYCTYMSTGAILLADILPGLSVKLIAPFLPFFVHIRMLFCVAFAITGYLLVAFSKNLVLSIAGVVFTSCCSGLGEATLLQYSTFYDKNVISTWSSGTGGAGVIGALSYTLLQTLGMQTTLLIMLIIPSMMALSFWLLLPKPSDRDIAQALEIQRNVNREEEENPLQTFKKKIRLIPGLLKYIIPFSTVYLFEYFINQGMFELIDFDNDLTSATQYRWFQVTYQIGVFVSRSSVNIYHIKQTWIMSVFQGINVIIFTTEAIYAYLPNFYVALLLVLWEGLLGGSSYVNTFYRISQEVPEENKQFSMSITTFGDSIGIALAGVLAIFAHNAICDSR